MFEWNDDVLYKATMKLKQKNPKLRISLAVGGWNHEGEAVSKLYTYLKLRISLAVGGWNHEGEAVSKLFNSILS